ncbi:MAG: phage tail protein [Desulfobulbaceae bacterium]|nr:phage tail protein [Desulfobulbaceae bacterium]
MGGGGKGKSCATTGYRYYAGLHLVFCHGLNHLLKIRVGDQWAWEGDAVDNTAIYVNSPELFGGDAREGGIVGTVDPQFGLSTQPQNGYLQSVLGSVIPAYRGLFGLVARKCQMSANNPYIKEWGILGQRTSFGWHDEWATIVASDGFADMNPVHIIYETLTNTSWGGLGYPTADLDMDSFEDAAYKLAQGVDPNQEAFGLSLVWAKNSSVEDFLGLILSHIEAVLYPSHITGLITLKLIRNDYTLAMTPILDTSNIIDLVDFQNSSAAEAPNQLSINWVDRDNSPQTTTVHDIAGIARANGQVIATSMEFVGIATEDWAQKIAARELQQVVVPIASVTLEINRRNFSLEPGDIFRFSWAPLGIVEMVMRVAKIEINVHTDSKIRISASRDVYGLGATPFTQPSGSLWTSPISAPADAIKRKVDEVTWWQFVQQYGESAAVLAEIDDSSTLVTCFCGRPSSDAMNYQMWSRNVGAPDYALRDTDNFPFIGTVVGAMVPELESTITLLESIDTNMVAVGQYAALGNELVWITAINPVLSTVTIARGVLDTIPVSHADGETIWCHQNFYGLDGTERAVGEQVEIRMLPSTASGRLDLGAATTEAITCAGRMMRPYPPGNVKINTLRWPDSIGAAEALTVSWAHRDRTLQTAAMIYQDAADIGPEPGVTYTLRLYGETDVLKKTVTGLTGTTYTWATEVADSGLGRLNTSVRVGIESARGAIVSLQKWNVVAVRL